MSSKTMFLAQATAVAFGFAAAPAQAGILFPPAGTHAFVALYETDSGQHECQPECALVSSPGFNADMPVRTFTGGSFNFITGGGSTGPDALHGSVSTFNAATLDVAMGDTYTVHGGSGPFAVTASMHVTGAANTLPLSATLNELLVGGAKATIGAFDFDPNTTDVPIVAAFDPSTTGTSGGATRVGAPQSVPIDFTVNYTRMVNPGDVFDVAYELELFLGGPGEVDVSHTADISFTLPGDVFLTAASGATFGTLPGGGGVPEPASWALMVVGFGGLGAVLRRRRIQLA